MLLLCPYCLGPWAEGTAICPRCGEDTRNDAVIEMSTAELDACQRKPCVACGASLLRFAVRCGECRASQRTP